MIYFVAHWTQDFLALFGTIAPIEVVLFLLALANNKKGKPYG